MVFLWCSCGGVFVVVFLCWCFCAGVFVVVSCCGVFVVVSCCGVFVVVCLCWCFCAGVFVLVFLWWCLCGGVFVKFTLLHCQILHTYFTLLIVTIFFFTYFGTVLNFNELHSTLLN